MIDMLLLAKNCMEQDHPNRQKMTIGGEEVELCQDCIERVLENIKIADGWYDPYG